MIGMSASGTKRTSELRLTMSAFGGKADMACTSAVSRTGPPSFSRTNFFQLGAFARFQNEFFSTWRSRLARFPNKFFFNTLSKDEARRMLGAGNGASMVVSF
jgi:hypothetical protein